MVELRCVACLEKFKHEMKVPAFALHMDLHGPETIDITSALREDILLNLPAHPHCDRDGRQVCRGPKIVAAVDTASPERVQAEKREHDWGELDKLKIKNH